MQSFIIGCTAALLYLLVSTRAVIGQFSGPYSPVRPQVAQARYMSSSLYVVTWLERFAYL